ncbi:MAG: GGDEF domain-containing protein [Myxococcota bacterium]|nr:GGDEF domain-containing protein [Myxococcota bacterium]
MALTLAVAVSVLVGWVVGSLRLTALVPGMTAMNPLTAVCFILTAMALLGSPLRATGLRRGAIVGVAIVVGGCGIVRLSAYIAGWDLPIDQLLVPSQLEPGGAQPNRMAPNTALNFVAVAVILGSLVAGRTRWTQGAVTLVLLTSGIALLGYAYSVTSLVRVAAFIPMALHTAGLFVMVCAAALCAAPEVGMVAMLTRRSAGGRMLRVMLPTFVVGPPVLGWLRLQGELAGLYTPAFGVAMLISAMVVLGFALTWSTARAMDLGEAERQRADAILLQQAHYDSLTGLPNRALLGDRLRHALARADREGHGVAVLFLDLDGFKRVNDTVGHEAGDAVLKEAALRMLSAVRAVDTAARLGGDEFIVVLEKITSAAEVRMVASRLIDQLGRPYAGIEARLSVSVGGSLFPQDTREAEGLVKLADAAMYRAKRAGKNQLSLHAAGELEGAPGAGGPGDHSQLASN